MNPNVLTEEDLKAMTGYTSRKPLYEHLKREGFRVHTGKEGRVYVVLTSETREKLDAV